MELRPYQLTALDSVYKSWRDNKNVMLVLPTGAGKTVTFTRAVRDHDGPSLIVAHRQELVCQISLALCSHGVNHNLIAPKNVIREIIRQQVKVYNTVYYIPNSPVSVAGVDTLLRRKNELAQYLRKVTLIVQDEGHHVLKKNKWGKAASLVPNARGLYVTATPVRADGNGLGRHADGIIDDLIVGPDMRDMINRGYLTEYEVYAPKSTDLDLSNVPTGSTGDYSAPKLRGAMRKSKIIGDVVSHYMRIAPGKLGIVFTVDVESAQQIAGQFIDAGVAAESISHKTPDKQRNNILDAFKSRRIQVLTNVDLFGEGFDLPAVEVVSFARPTQSYALYVQQFGRALRILDGKKRAIIIDHVGNVTRHLLPDHGRDWSLDRRERSSRKSEINPYSVCPKCTRLYQKYLDTCPYCGHVPEKLKKSSPEQVSGDLTLLTDEALAALRTKVTDTNKSAVNYAAELRAKGCPEIGIRAHTNRHERLLSMRENLKSAINDWGESKRNDGFSDSENYKKFYIEFGVDVLTALTVDKNTTAKMIEELCRKNGQ